MHIPTALDISFVGLPVPGFTPRWRCDGEPALRVIVGRARAVQQALATTSSSVPRLAVVIGALASPVDCADLIVRVRHLRDARAACSVLVSLATSRRDTLIHTQAGDLARIVAAGAGGEGLLLRRRGATLMEAARQITGQAAWAGPHAMVVGMTACSRPGSLDDLNNAMSLLGDVDDQVTELALGLRDATARRTTPTIELLAALSTPSQTTDRDVTHSE